MNSREILKFPAISWAVFGSSLFKKGIKMKIRTTVSSRIALSPPQTTSHNTILETVASPACEYQHEGHVNTK